MGTIRVPKVYERKGQVIVFDEKYGKRYFLAETKEQVYAACLTILQEKYEFSLVVPKEPEYHELPKPDVRWTAPFKDLYQELRQKNEKMEKEYLDHKYFYDIYRKALDENNGALAWFIISEMFYDYYDFRYLENVDDSLQS